MKHPRIGFDSIDDASFLDLFGDMRIGKLSLSADECEKAFAHRRDRLTRYAAQANAQDRDVIVTAIGLSDACHDYAKKMTVRIQSIHQSLPSTPDDKFEHVVNKMSEQRRTIRAGIAPEGGAEVSPDPWWDESIDFFRKIRQSPKDDDNKRLNDVVTEYFVGRDPTEVTAHRMHVALILTTLRSADTAVFAAAANLELWMILRGILYAGIFRYQGGAIERREAVNSGKGLLWSATGGQVPGLDIMLALKRVLSAWLETDQCSDDLFKASAFIDKYFSGYTQLLEAWRIHAERLTTIAEQSAHVIVDRFFGGVPDRA